MFARFYKEKVLAPAMAAVVTSHVVRDAHTRQVICRGTYQECVKFQNAFGSCYVEEV